MNRTHRGKRERTRLADFTPTAPNHADDFLHQGDFAGMDPDAAARRIADFRAERRRHRDVTRQQTFVDLRTLLREQHGRGRTMGNLTPEDAELMREWLRHRAEIGEISETYAAHLAQTWNASMRAVFGETSRPGEGLIMKGFPSRARHERRLDEADFNALLAGAHRRRYRSPLDRESFITYLEVEWSAGARIRSIQEARWKDVDYDAMKLVLRHMKNREDGTPHEVVLTPRATARLRWMEDYLRQTSVWEGPDDTPIIPGSSGRPLTNKAVNDMLKGAAAHAGMNEPMRTHRIRKSVGTLIGRKNPRLAAEQLGITMKIFEAHYNMPSLEDRLERRDLIPGYEWTPKSAEELIGFAHLERARGRMSEEDFQAALAHADRMRALPGRHVSEVDPYA